MARLPYADPGRVPALNILRLIAHAEAAYWPWLRYSTAILKDLQLDPVLRELVILRVSAVAPGGDYEWVQHEPVARAMGLSDARIAGARSGVGLEGDDALVVTFTDEVLRDGEPSDATFEAARARLTPRDIVELLLVIGHYRTLMTVMATARIDPEPTPEAGTPRSAGPASLSGAQAA